MRSTRRSWLIGSVVLVTAATGLAGVAPATAASAAAVRTIVSGLNSPRGIAFDGQGGMYVAESGLALGGATGATRTGMVDKYAAGSSTAVWRKSFTSLHDSTEGTPEALGPEGLSALPSTCTRPGGDCQVRMIMSESQVGTADAGSPLQLGNLYALNGGTGHVRALSNVGDQQWAWTLDHKHLSGGDFPDSNPYGLLVTAADGHLRTFVADAGANTISEVLPSGATHVIAYIPNETTVAKRDATPTCIAQGPDGALYVGTLDLLSNFAAQGGQSHVYRIDPDTHEGYLKAARLWASGLTSITACTFDRSGNFWATELFGPTTQGAPGDLVRIPFRRPAAVTHLGQGQVILPGGIAQGPDGAMYVTTHTADPTPGSGQVVRVSTGR